MNVIDPTKDNLTEPLSFKEILDGLDIFKDDYYKGLSISKDEDLEFHFKRQPNYCFVDSYFDVGLKSWQANNERFLTRKMRETQVNFFLMKSIYRTSNVLIFSQMRLKAFFLRKKILNLLIQSM